MNEVLQALYTLIGVNLFSVYWFGVDELLHQFLVDLRIHHKVHEEVRVGRPNSKRSSKEESDNLIYHGLVIVLKNVIWEKDSQKIRIVNILFLLRPAQLFFSLLNYTFTEVSDAVNIAQKFSVRRRIVEHHQIGKDAEDSATGSKYLERNASP
jgi:hypothetical protein